MDKIFYNKLVRDLIADKLDHQGEAYEMRTLQDNEEFRAELLKKVVEEAQELSRSTSRDSFLQEYADLMAVLDALTSLMEFSEADIRTAIEENVQKKGLFKKRQFLNWAAPKK